MAGAVWRESQNKQEKDKADVPRQMPIAAQTVQWLGMLQPQVRYSFSTVSDSGILRRARNSPVSIIYTRLCVNTSVSVEQREETGGHGVTVTDNWRLSAE